MTVKVLHETFPHSGRSRIRSRPRQPNVLQVAAVLVPTPLALRLLVAISQSSASIGLGRNEMDDASSRLGRRLLTPADGLWQSGHFALQYWASEFTRLIQLLVEFSGSNSFDQRINHQRQLIDRGHDDGRFAFFEFDPL